MKKIRIFAGFAVCLIFIASGCGDRGPVEKEKEAVKKTTDPEKLTKIALATRDQEVSNEAVALINDQLLLLKIAKEGKDTNVRLAALDKLTDQPLIAKLVSDGQDMDLRRKAMARITEPLLLADLAMWVNPEAAGKVSDREALKALVTRAWLPAIRNIAVAKLDDAEVLKTVALGDASGSIRRKALSKLTDLAVIEKIAHTDPAWYVRQAAVAKLTDQKIISAIAASDSDSAVRASALILISSEPTLLEIAINDNSPEIRMAAARKLRSQEALARVVAEAKDNELQEFVSHQITDPDQTAKTAPWIKYEATMALNDTALLARIAQNAFNKDVRKAAVQKLSDAGILCKIALEDKDIEVRKAAAGKLQDQAALKTIAVKSTDDNIRLIAFERITDQGLLAETAANTNVNYLIRLAAVTNLADQALLIRIAGNSNENYSIRSAAAGMITDQEVLAKLVLEDENWSIRNAAEKKITDPAIKAKIEPWLKEACTKKVTDQDLLVKIATASRTYNISRAAVSNITDQVLLVKIAGGNGSVSGRAAAVERVTSTPLIDRLAADTNTPHSVRLAAVRKLADQALLARIAGSTNEVGDIRLAALKMTTNQTLFAKIAGNAKENYMVREFALKTVDNDALLASVATNIHDNARQQAVTRLKDQHVLAQVATKDVDKNIRQSALWKISNSNILARIGPWTKKDYTVKVTNQALLSEIAVGAKDPFIRLAAVEKCTNQTVLAKVLADDVDKDVRGAAVEKVTSQELLARLARTDASEEIRKKAFARLTDTALKESAGKWASPEFAEQVTDRVLLAEIASYAKDKKVCEAAIRKLTGREDMSPLVAFEWLSHCYRKTGQNDDAYLALLMGTMLYDQKTDNASQLSLTTYNQACEMRSQTAVQAGIASLMQKGQPENKITILDLADAVNKTTLKALQCQDEELVSTVTRAFRENLTITPPKEQSKTQKDQIRYLQGDIPFVSALGLAMFQRSEDWPYVERFLASRPFMVQFNSYLRAMTTNDTQFTKALLSHPSPMIRANALITLGKSPSEGEKDMLVKVAGAINSPGINRTNAVQLLKQGLEDERHAVRLTAIQGLIKYGVDIPLDNIKQSIKSTDAWRKKYTLGCMVFTITSAVDPSLDGKQFFLTSETPSEFAVDGELLQAGYALLASKVRLSDGEYDWLLQQITGNPNEGGAMFYMSTVPDMAGYRVEYAQPRTGEKLNSDIAEVLGKHASQHSAQLLKAIREANPYARLFLVQAAGTLATNADGSAELWRIAEASLSDPSAKAYRDKLYTDKVRDVEKGLMWNQKANYTAIGTYADEVSGQIAKLTRRFAINHLAACAEDETEFNRLARLLGNKEGARAVVPVLLNRGKESITRYATLDLFKHTENEVRMSAAILRLYIEDSADARRVLTEALQNNPDGVEFTARVALAVKKPAINEVLLSLKDVKPLTIAGYLLRRIEFDKDKTTSP